MMWSQTSSISISWVFVRNVDYPAPPHTYWITICILTRPSGDLYVHLSFMCSEDSYMMGLLSGLGEEVEVRQLEPDINAKCWINVNYYYILLYIKIQLQGQLSCQASYDLSIVLVLFSFSIFYLCSTKISVGTFDNVFAWTFLCQTQRSLRP